MSDRTGRRIGMHNVPMHTAVKAALDLGMTLDCPDEHTEVGDHKKYNETDKRAAFAHFRKRSGAMTDTSRINTYISIL
jgi:hypothetical protein